MHPNSSSFIRCQCILHDSGVIFSKSSNFCKLRRGDLISGENQFRKNSELFGSHLLYFNFKSSKYSFSSSFIRFQCILQDSGVLFLKYLQIKEGRPNFWWEKILQKVWIIWSPLLYFNFKSFMDPNFLSFIRFQCILHDSVVLFSESWNFYKLKRGDLISGWNQFCTKSELFGPSFCISILKVL